MQEAVQLAWMRARKKFRGYRGVIGVGLDRDRERGTRLDYRLVVYVMTKLPKEKVEAGQLVPRVFDGLRTDVRVPNLVPRQDGPQCMAGDVRWIDWEKIHQLNRTRILPDDRTHWRKS
jgi:hypothetical protein